MGGEHGAPTGQLKSPVKRIAVALARELEWGQRRMALIEVDDTWFVAHRPQRANSPHPEQRVLGQPGLRISVIQPSGDPSLERAVARAVAVEQEQRHTTNLHAPHARADI